MKKLIISGACLAFLVTPALAQARNIPDISATSTGIRCLGPTGGHYRYSQSIRADACWGNRRHHSDERNRNPCATSSDRTGGRSRAARRSACRPWLEYWCSKFLVATASRANAARVSLTKVRRRPV